MPGDYKKNNKGSNKGSNYHVAMCKRGSQSDLSAAYQPPVGCAVSSSVFAAEIKLDCKSDVTPVRAGPQMPPDQPESKLHE